MKAGGLLLLSAFVGGIGALYFGFALEWDLLNYHLYNPHALWTGRMALDVAPAQQQTFLNPAMFLPLYLVFEYLGAGAFVFVIGAIQGSQIALLLLIADELTGKSIRPRRILLLVAILGLCGPIFLNQLGGSQGDTLLSVLVLAGLLIVLRGLGSPAESSTLRAGLLGGLLLGMACAFKLTLTIYAVGLALASFVSFSGADRWRIILGLALGGVAGVFLAGGPWFLFQWAVYGNPLFPYFNNLFGSQWIDAGSFRDMRFMPGSVTEWLFYPVYWLIDPHRVWEFSFRDIRVPMVLALVFVLPLFAWRRIREQAPALGLTCLFMALSYVLWIKVFSIYRYLSVIEFLAPLVLFSSVALFTRSRRVLLAAVLVLAASQLFVQYHRGPASWEFQADSETLLSDLPPGSMVVIDGYEPVAYAALWLPDTVPLVRIRANFMRQTVPDSRLQKLAHHAVSSHPGPLYLLLPAWEMDAEFISADLEQVGLAAPDKAGCNAVFRSEALQKQLQLMLCPLERLPVVSHTGPL